tara:strand:+ start:354 stop:1052 length:699 start_codon:yes stop_codon:yes gene_type:complete
MPFAAATPTTSLSIRGPTAKEGTLAIIGPVAVSGTPSLFLAAPPSLVMPLVIGVTRYGLGSSTLYVDGAATSDPIAEDYQGYATLTITPTPNASDSSTMSLYLDTHRIGSGINTGPLYLSGTSPLSTSKSADLQLRGMHATAGDDYPHIGEFGGETTLYIRHKEMLSDNMPLNIEKGFNAANTATLYINSQIGSGHVPLLIDSTMKSNDSIPLSISTPPSGNVTLYMRGYLE